MKQIRLIMILLFLSIFSGCVHEFNYSEEQSDAAAEYMAGLILKYDEDYEQDLVSFEDIIVESVTEEAEETLIPSPAVIPDKITTSPEKNPPEPEKDYTLTQVLGVEGFDLSYSGYMVTDTYPKDQSSEYFSIDPRPGNQLIVLSFLLTNTADAEQKINLSKEDMYQLDINLGTIYKPSLSLMENDLRLIDSTLAGGEAKPVILIFEVKKEVEMTDIDLMVSKDNKTEIVEIK